MTFPISLIGPPKFRISGIAILIGMLKIELDFGDRNGDHGLENRIEVLCQRSNAIMSRISWTVPASSASAPPTSFPATGLAGTPAYFTATAGGFVVAGPWAAIYRMAYEQALAAAAPSKFQKMLEPCWN